MFLFLFDTHTNDNISSSWLKYILFVSLFWNAPELPNVVHVYLMLCGYPARTNHHLRFVYVVFPGYMAEILPTRRKTLSNQSILQSL